MRNNFVKILSILIACLGIQHMAAQMTETRLDSIILNSKIFNYQLALQQLNRLEESSLKSLLKANIEYLQNGFLVNSDSLHVLDLDGKQLYVGRYLLAEIMGREELGKDSLIYNLYKNSLNEAKKENDTLVVNEIYRRLNLHVFRNSNELETFKKLIEQNALFVTDNTDKFYLNYFKIGYQMLLSEKESKIDTAYFMMLYDEAKHLARRSYLKGYIHQFESIFYGSYLKDTKRGFESNKAALEYYEKETFYLARRSASSVRFNMGVDYYHEEAYDKAIPFFIEDLKTQKNMLYKMYGYDWLYKSYDALSRHDSAYFYFKKMVETKDKLDRLKHATVIKRIEGEFDLIQKEEELAQLSKEKTTLQTRFFTLLPVLGIITLISIIIFFLYKKYYKKTTVLQEEKSETLQKLDELKNIVIKNHIILKDKTKVYISDLMYIKSDDHYLNVYTSDDKNHFVRGKLCTIKEELPPNFIQCHRSYIVNRNFIKRINNDSITLVDKTNLPLSRSYKKKF